MWQWRGVFVSGRPNRPPELGLRLSIKDVSKRFVTAGQSLTADVRLTNTGDKSIALPWDPNQTIVYGKDCQGIGPPGPGHPVTLEGSLLLKLARGKVEGDVVGGHSLYSRMDQLDSYRVLQPGQSAVIRVGGKFNPPSTDNIGHPKRRPGTFRLIAVFTLTDSAKLNPYRSVVSENSVAVAEASR